jgi:hypothetical protein
MGSGQHRYSRSAPTWPAMRTVDSTSCRVNSAARLFASAMNRAGPCQPSKSKSPGFGWDIWLARAGELGLPTPEEFFVELVCVGGHESFAAYAELMELLAVPYSIVADGPAFVAAGPLTRLPGGGPDASVDATEFAQVRQWWSQHRVHTLAEVFGTGGDHGGEVEAFFSRTDSTVWDEICARPRSGRGKQLRRVSSRAACRCRPRSARSGPVCSVT